MDKPKFGSIIEYKRHDGVIELGIVISGSGIDLADAYKFSDYFKEYLLSKEGAIGETW